MSGVNMLVWIVLLLFADSLCNDDFEGCKNNQCQNGGVCIRNKGNYTCQCSNRSQNGQLYGGPNCTVVLHGCERHRCQNGAKCSPFLSSGRHRYRCACPEGYTGLRCETSTTFSFEKSGFLHIKTDLEDTVALLNTTLSFRTVQKTATLLRCEVEEYVLTLQLQNGRLRHSMQWGNSRNSDLVDLFQDVADGNWHTVQVYLYGSVLGLDLHDPVCTVKTCHKEVLVELDLGSGSGQSSFNLVQSVYIGGTGNGQVNPESFFLGCMRDVYIQSHLVVPELKVRAEQFSMTLGCRESDGCDDNPCRNRGKCVGLGWKKHKCECHRPYEGKMKPCLNGGVCYSMWDDFTCSCPPNTTGQRCQELKWCELSPCPVPAGCLTQAQGFDCVTNITVREGNHVVVFRGNGEIRRPLRSVSLTFRTRRRDTTLLHASRENHFITLLLKDGRLALELQSGSNISLRVQSRRVMVNDGRWHSAILSMNNPSAPTSRWSMVLDERRDQASISTTSSGDLDFLREDTDILLAGLDLDTGADLDGCLGLVEIGGLVLPFHAETDLGMPRPQKEKFLRVSGMLTLGCWGSDICNPNPCHNGGQCEDLFDLFKCRCPADWHGQICEVRTDACYPNPCLHGSCVVDNEGYECVCESGYVGRRCESKEDVCVGHKCRNGGTCLRGIKQYACLCPRNTTGALCQERMPEMPWYIDRLPSPRLPVSICGNDKWTYSCFNGGNCSMFENKCECLSGFSGQWCELELDECASGPCLNGGYCRNLVDRFHCVCEISFAGERCQIDISDFYLYGFLLMWQNIFQLLSFLVLRMDDEPEIEWNAANEE